MKKQDLAIEKLDVKESDRVMNQCLEDPTNMNLALVLKNVICKFTYLFLFDAL